MTGRWSQLDRRVRSVAAKGTCFGLRPNAGTKSDRTLAGCVRSVLTYVDVRRTEETLCDRTLGESSRFVMKCVVWNLTGNDRTLDLSVRSLSN